MLDGIRRFGTSLLKAETVIVDRNTDLGELRSLDFIVVEAVGEAHVQPALDSSMAYSEGSMMRAIIGFLELT